MSKSLGGTSQWIRQLRYEGLRQQVSDTSGSPVGALDNKKMEQRLQRRDATRNLIAVPGFGPPDDQALRRGEALYHAYGCISCHGPDGVGSWSSTWFDERLRPVRPRDLAHEPMKGGAEPASIYLRIVAGMPGTPHPASPTLTQPEAVDLVHYCRSLADERSILTNHQRAQRATSEAYLSAIGRDHSPTDEI